MKKAEDGQIAREKIIGNAGSSARSQRHLFLFLGLVILLAIAGGWLLGEKLKDWITDSGERADIDQDRNLPGYGGGADIARWLSDAERMLARDGLLESGGQAAKLYRMVLKADPGNTQALLGLNRLAEHYASLIRSTVDAGDLSQALDLADIGLRVLPRNSLLLDLRNDIEARLSSRQKVSTKIESLIKEANTALESGDYRVAAPVAAAIYRQIFLLDDENRQAAAGLLNIAARGLRLGRTALADGNLDEAMAYTLAGLHGAPSYRPLLELRVTIEAAQRNRHDSQRLAELLVEARTLLQQGHLIEPRRKNALEYYHRALELDPANQMAQQGLAQVADLLRDNARRKLAKGDFQQARALVDAGLSIAPGRQDLLELRSATTAYQASIDKLKRIQVLLNKADVYLHANALTTPAGSNAFELYRQVLEIDADNAAAKAGVNRIADRYFDMAQTRNARGDRRGAIRFVNRGLGVVPTHENLKALREELQRQPHTTQQTSRVAERMPAKEDLSLDEVPAPATGKVIVIAPASAFTVDKTILQPGTFLVLVDNVEKGELTSEQRRLTVLLNEGPHDLQVIYQSATRLLRDLGPLGKMFQYKLYIDYAVKVKAGDEQSIRLPAAQHKDDFHDEYDWGQPEKSDGPTWRRTR